MVETRLHLAAVELEEEKANLIQLWVMDGLTLLFTAFGLMSLLILIFWAIDPLYLLMALGATTGVLLFLAIVGTIWTLVKVQRTTLLGATRNNWPSTTLSWKGGHESQPRPKTRKRKPDSADPVTAAVSGL